MSTKLITVSSDAGIDKAIQAMLGSQISGLPVVDDAYRVVGIVTEGDFLRREELGTERRRPRWLSFLIGSGSLATDYTHSHGRKVCDVMSAEVVTVLPDATIEHIIDLMIDKGVKRVPVVKDGMLVGIVTRSDILRMLARALPTTRPGPLRDDADILSEISAVFDREQCIPEAAVNVLVRDGQVELHGTITDERQRAAVRVAVENIQGVRSVKDHLIWVEPLTGVFELSQEDQSIEDSKPMTLAKAS